MKTVYQMIFYLFILLIDTSVSRKSKKGESCINYHQNSTVNFCHSITLTCNKKKDLISYLDIVSDSHPCKQRNSGCQGPAVDTVADILSCYWKNRCSIRIPQGPMLYFDSTVIVESRCNTKPNSLRIRNLSCSRYKRKRVKQIRNICKDDGKVQIIQGAAVKRGIVKSHDETPWDYQRDELQPVYRSCKLNISFPEENSYRISLTFLWVDIDVVYDRLNIHYHNGTQKQAETIHNVDTITTKHFYPKTQDFQIQFEMNTADRNGDIFSAFTPGKGFLFCFEVYTKDEKLIQNACRKLLKKQKAKSIKIEKQNYDECKSVQERPELINPKKSKKNTKQPAKKTKNRSRRNRNKSTSKKKTH